MGNIRIRYWVALLIIAISISSAFVILSQQFYVQEGLATNVNVSGQQRMLSQKIALLATRKIAGLRSKSISVENSLTLKNAAIKMQQNQQQLNAAYQQNFVPNLKALYGKKHRLNERVADYTLAAITLSKIENIDGLSNVSVELFETETVEQLLADLNKAVTYIEQDILAGEKNYRDLAIILWCFVLFILLVVAYYTFRPVHQAILDTYKQLKDEQYKVLDYRFALNKHSLSIKFSPEKTVLTVNKKFYENYGYHKNELIGQDISIMFSDVHSLDNLNEIFDVITAGNIWRGQLCTKSKSGRLFWFDTTIVPLKNSSKMIESFMVLQNDITEQINTQNSLRKLHSITANSALSLSDKINTIMEQGKALYQLPLAIVSQISGEEYKVMYSSTPNGEVSPGDVFELGNTYCFHTLMANEPTSYHHVKNSEIKEHPCYQNFGLESYIGAPIFVGGRRYGTLNFSSPEPSPYPYKHSDLELVQLMAQWIGFELERNEQQVHLVEQQSLMEQMSQLARIGAWEVDLVNQKINWSDMTKEIHEVDKDYEPDLDTAINFYKEGESRNKIEKLIEKSMSAGTPYNEELQLVTAKGNEIWVAAKGESEFKDGECVRMFGSFQDISQKKETEQALVAQNRRFSLAADSAGIGVWEYDIENETLKWDDWMFELYGIQKESFSGAIDAWENGVHKEDAQEAARVLQNSIDTGDKFQLQFRIVWPDGTIRYLKAAAMVLKNEQHQSSRLIGVNYDVTDRVENEQALTQAKLAAEAGAKAKNEFLASMSHEIRTPMNGVIGMLDLLINSDLNEEQQHRANIAQSSASSLLHLINDILDFSKIDADKLDLEEVSFDLEKMLSELVESFAVQVQAKNIDLIVDTVDVSAHRIIGDSSRIRQILTNLISNAIKFTHHGEVLVTAALTSLDEDSWQLKTQVKDSGIGIAPEKQSELFESFSQVDASTTREYGGTGLGLSIVKKLCVLMGGDITLTSDVGKGSCFTSTIVVKKSLEHIDKSMTDLSGIHILVYEENKTACQVIKQQCQQWGAKVTIADDVEQIQEVAQQHLNSEQPLFDLFLAGIQGTDDLNVVQQLIEKANCSALPVVCMTPIQFQYSHLQTNNMCCIGQITKPITTTDLRHAMNMFFDAQIPTEQTSQLESHTNNLFNPNENVFVLDDELDTFEEKLNPLVGNSAKINTTKILLVEDNRVNQMVAKGVLDYIGVTSEIAVNGKDAIEQLKQNPCAFGLILMDIQMPEMDGYQATKAIRRGDAGEKVKDIKIVAMTANAMRGDREKCLQAGMNDYLAKPINKDALVEKLSFWIGIN
jgi:two-component system, sensor histidine kinase and response regulator